MCAAGVPSSHSSAEGRVHAMVKQAQGFRVWDFTKDLGFRVYI